MVTPSQEVGTEIRLGIYLRVILWVVVIMFIGTILSLVRSAQITSAVNRLDAQTELLGEQTDAARLAAIEARDALQVAIAELESDDDVDPNAILEALVSVDRIEQYLCGGPCG